MKRVPALSAGPGALSDLSVCAEWQQGIRKRGSPLLHHVDVDRLRAADLGVKAKAAPRVDGVTWADYGLDLEETFGTCMLGFTEVRTGRDLRGGCTCRNPMGGCARSGLLRWRTRSSNGQWLRC